MRCSCGGKLIRKAAYFGPMWHCGECGMLLCTGRDPHAPAKKESKESGTAANGVVNSSGKER